VFFENISSTFLLSIEINFSQNEMKLKVRDTSIP